MHRRRAAFALATVVALLACCGCSPLSAKARDRVDDSVASNLEFVASIVTSLAEDSLAGANVTESKLRDNDWTVVFRDDELPKPIKHVAIFGFESATLGSLTVSVFVRQAATESAGLDSASVVVHGCATVTSDGSAPVDVRDIDCPTWLRPHEWNQSEKISLERIWDTDS